ncbi:MAG: endo-1,4-beta-xylanase [Planctomycetota bacterium]
MGMIRFRLHDRDRIAPGALDRIFVAGLEEIPWSTRARFEGDQLVVERSLSDSGFVSVPWQVEGLGSRVLNTATLMERERPYVLEVELARGLIQRIRTRLFMWETLGLAAPPELKEQLHTATREFSLAATSQDELAEAAVSANRAISLALSAGEALVASYAKQAIAARRRQSPVPTLMGVNLGAETPSVALRQQLADACNIVQLPVAWRTIEQTEGKREWKPTEVQLAWAQKAGLKVAAGPLLRMDSFGTPDWMVLWEGDFDNLARVALEHVRAVVTRYAGRVHLWHVASRINTGKLMQLEEEQRLHLVAQALDVVRQIDPRTPTVVSFDQPWAEYMAQQDEDLAPLHYADALVRADLGISGFGLEINAGYAPHGSGHRATFELGRLLDQWSIWGLPLMLSISTASSAADDPQARLNTEIDLSQATATHPQREWAATTLPLLLARSAVQVVFWNQLTDSQPHDFPHAGIFDARNQAKPTLGLMRDLRKSCLM